MEFESLLIITEVGCSELDSRPRASAATAFCSSDEDREMKVFKEAAVAVGGTGAGDAAQDLLPLLRQCASAAAVAPAAQYLPRC